MRVEFEVAKKSAEKDLEKAKAAALLKASMEKEYVLERAVAKLQTQHLQDKDRLHKLFEERHEEMDAKKSTAIEAALAELRSSLTEKHTKEKEALLSEYRQVSETKLANLREQLEIRHSSEIEISESMAEAALVTHGEELQEQHAAELAELETTLRNQHSEDRDTMNSAAKESLRLYRIELMAQKEAALLEAERRALTTRDAYGQQLMIHHAEKTNDKLRVQREELLADHVVAKDKALVEIEDRLCVRHLEALAAVKQEKEAGVQNLRIEKENYVQRALVEQAEALRGGHEVHINELRGKYHVLETQFADLQIQFDELQSAYDELHAKRDSWELPVQEAVAGPKRTVSVSLKFEGNLADLPPHSSERLQFAAGVEEGVAATMNIPLCGVRIIELTAGR
jgi:hypothetical protein